MVGPSDDIVRHDLVFYPMVVYPYFHLNLAIVTGRLMDACQLPAEEKKM